MRKFARWMAFGSVGFLVVALGIVGAGMAVAEESGAEEEATSQRRGRAPSMRTVARIADNLELDEQQQGYLDEMKELRKSERSARRAVGGGCMKDVMKAMKDENADADAVHAAIDARFAQARGSAHARANTMIAFFSSLDPQQKAALLEEMKNARSERQSRMRGEGRGDRKGSSARERGQRGQRGQRGPRGGGERSGEEDLY